MSSAFNDTEKLISCTVTNRYKEQSVRLIELANFKLWEYLMTSKHGARINEINLCLWLSHEEYMLNESIYSRSGDATAVNRVIVDLFDEEYGFSNPVVRYVRANETEQIIKILTSHISRQVQESDNCNIFVHEGYNITQRQHIEKGAFRKGLEEV